MSCNVCITTFHHDHFENESVNPGHYPIRGSVSGVNDNVLKLSIIVTAVCCREYSTTSKVLIYRDSCDYFSLYVANNDGYTGY